jgi:MFS family permease
MLILAFNSVDRLALGVVLEDLKTELALSDTQLGFMSGIAFTVFYAVMGIPIARWADRGDRVRIIAVTTALWSGAVALCGMAASFAQLLLIRVGVAVGEAGCTPPALSLIADNFDRMERPRAVARYLLGGPLALVIGYFVAGWLNELYGWRVTFVAIGLPGLVLAALAHFSLKEPRRSHSVPGRVAPAAVTPPFAQVVVTLWANRAFRHLLFCFSVWYFFGYGLLQWQPTFFIRTHGLETGELGTWFALVYGICGALGIYAGGEWISRHAAGDERLQLNICALGFALSAAFTAGAYLAPNHYWAFAMLALAGLSSLAQAPIIATMQTLVPPRMRALSMALVYLFANLVGMGLGPLAAGALSDALRPVFADESLRYALLMLCPGYGWAAWHLWRAGRTVARDVARAQAEDDPAPRFSNGLSDASIE